ncbi:MAG: TerC family protein [Pseudomonadota bacterium]
MSNSFLFSLFLGQPTWFWLIFLSIVITILVVDLGILNREAKEIGVRESLTLTLVYIIISLLFGLFVWHQMGADHAFNYYTGYVIEKSLSMDNLFVMAVIFSALSIPRKYQHRVLFWGILGVIVLRGTMISLGTAIVHEFEWVLYLFAIFLVVTGTKLVFTKDDEESHEEDVLKNPAFQFLKKRFPLTGFHGQKFFVKIQSKKTGKMVLHMTPLFLALITIEIADVIFAVDSIPAIFAITTEPFIVYTSNIFAILGLRALFFSLSALMARFAYLKYAISLILIFIGLKVFAPLFLDIEKVPASISLSVTLILLFGGMIISLMKTSKK